MTLAYKANSSKSWESGTSFKRYISWAHQNWLEKVILLRQAPPENDFFSTKGPSQFGVHFPLWLFWTGETKPPLWKPWGQPLLFMALDLSSKISSLLIVLASLVAIPCTRVLDVGFTWESSLVVIWKTFAFLVTWVASSLFPSPSLIKDFLSDVWTWVWVWPY